MTTIPRPRLFVLAFSLSAVPVSFAEEKIQSLDAIYEFVKATAAQSMSPDASFEINVLPLDSQLRLPDCTEALETSAKEIKVGRTSIAVRCQGEKKWSIFVSAIIKAFQPVIVLTRSVVRGETISRDHLAIENKDISATRGDFFSLIEDVENKEAVRNLEAGVILGSKNVIEPPLIRRKDKVLISSGQTGFSVQMSGTALSDGAKGQTIKVRNDSSGRVVSGAVVEAGVVLVR